MSNILQFFRTILGRTGSTLANGQAAKRPVLAKGLTPHEARAALAEMSKGDAETLRLFDAALAGTLPADSPFDAADDQVSVRVALMAALYATGRGVVLDWAEGTDESCDAFNQLFRSEGRRYDDLPGEIKFDGLLKRGDAVGLAYIAFRKLADANDQRILGINEGSDSYFFLLVTQATAERWASVRIDEFAYFEDSDWQFSKQMRLAGFEPRSTKHPSSAPRSAPSVV
jgi:hypothetical protein